MGEWGKEGIRSKDIWIWGRAAPLIPSFPHSLVPFFCGTITSPRASIATKEAILRALPAGVFMLFVRKASANRLTRFNDLNVFSARRFAWIA